MRGKTAGKKFSDLMFVVASVVLIASLWCVLDMEPEKWLPIVGLNASMTYLFPQYWNIMMKGEE